MYSLFLYISEKIFSKLIVNFCKICKKKLNFYIKNDVYINKR